MSPSINIKDFIVELEKLLGVSESRKKYLSKSRSVEESKSTHQIYESIQAALAATKDYLDTRRTDTEDMKPNVERIEILDQLIDSSESQIHIIQGPPGTGKTELIGIYVLLYLLQSASSGDKTTIYISAFTHKAVDNVLLRIERFFPIFYGLAKHICKEGPPQAFARMIRLHSASSREEMAEKNDDSPIREWDQWLNFGNRSHHAVGDEDRPLGIHDQRVLEQHPNWFYDDSRERKPDLLDRPTIIGATAAQIAKLNDKADLLILDEASMMMMPDFLVLANKVKKEGKLLIVGDDLQLAPITKNDWSKETRPSLMRDKPFNSVFHHFRRLAKPKPQKNSCIFETTVEGITWAALKTTYRLTSKATELIQPAYNRAGIILESKSDTTGEFQRIEPSSLQSATLKAVNLIAHDSEDAGTSNEHEANIVIGLIKKEINAGVSPDQIAVVTPYHDQIDKIREKLENDNDTKGKNILVDTVNKLQGDERELVIFSACVSGSEELATHGDFVMELQRTNVAFSRAKEHLVVIASQSLLDHIPSGFQAYQAALLWKNLRRLCEPQNNDDTTENDRKIKDSETDEFKRKQAWLADALEEQWRLSEEQELIDREQKQADAEQRLRDQIADWESERESWEDWINLGDLD